MKQVIAIILTVCLATLAMADRRIENCGDLELLHRALEQSIAAFEAESGPSPADIQQ